MPPKRKSGTQLQRGFQLSAASANVMNRQGRSSEKRCDVQSKNKINRAVVFSAQRESDFDQTFIQHEKGQIDQIAAASALGMERRKFKEKFEQWIGTRITPTESTLFETTGRRPLLDDKGKDELEKYLDKLTVQIGGMKRREFQRILNRFAHNSFCRRNGINPEDMLPMSDAIFAMHIQPSTYKRYYETCLEEKVRKGDRHLVAGMNVRNDILAFFSAFAALYVAKMGYDKQLYPLSKDLSTPTLATTFNTDQFAGILESAAIGNRISGRTTRAHKTMCRSKNYGLKIITKWEVVGKSKLAIIGEKKAEEWRKKNGRKNQ